MAHERTNMRVVSLVIRKTSQRRALKSTTLPLRIEAYACKVTLFVQSSDLARITRLLAFRPYEAWKTHLFYQSCGAEVTRVGDRLVMVISSGWTHVAS